MAAAGGHLAPGAEPGPNSVVYVRPHDIEIGPYDAAGQGLPAVLRYIHSAGPQARLILEQVQSRETIEVETSRSEIAELGLKVNDLVLLRLRRIHSFDDDYAI
jgi:sulfate transport system ATP-binding protein